MKKALNFILVFCLLLNNIALPFFAKEVPNQIKNGNKTAVWEDENKEIADINLTIGNTNESYSIDVVFILGGGMQANKETIQSAINVFKPIMKNNKNNSNTIKMGLISLEKGQEVIVDLSDEEAVLDPDTYEQFITDKFAYINSLPGGTTNLHSQLKEAKRMLAADTSVKPENKYVFVLATGRTYWFDDALGRQATIVNKLNNTYYYGNYVYQSQRGGHTSLYMVHERYNDDWDAYWADVCRWVEADGDTYVYSPLWDATDPYAYENWYYKNNKDLRELKVANSRFGLGIVDPVPTDENFLTGVAAAVGSGNNPQNALAYERAHYESAKVYQELIDAGYHCFSICSESPTYQNNSEYITLGAKYTGKSTIQLGHSFMNYLARLSGQEYAPTVWDFERDEDGNLLSTKTVLQEDFFEPIAEKIISTIPKEIIITDYIGYNSDETNGWNFDFVDEANTFNLSIGSKKYVAQKLEEPLNGATSSYEFYLNEDLADISLDYFKINDTTEEYFVLRINEKVSKMEPAVFKYKVKLKDKKTETGTYIVETNQQAYVEMVNPDGSLTEKEYFPIPELTYDVVTPPKYTITINYYNAQTGEMISSSYTEEGLKDTLYDVTEHDAIKMDGMSYLETRGDSVFGVLNSDKIINVYYDNKPPTVTLNFTKELWGTDSQFENLKIDRTKEQIFKIKLTEQTTNYQVCGLLSSTQGLTITQLPIGTYLIEELNDNYFDLISFLENNSEVISEYIFLEQTSQGYVLRISENLISDEEFNIKVINATEQFSPYEDKETKENIFFINQIIENLINS